MREHKTVSSNYRHLSTSTIFCDEKIWLREMMLKLNDVCCLQAKKKVRTVFFEFCFLGREEEEEMTSRPPSNRC